MYENLRAHAHMGFLCPPPTHIHKKKRGKNESEKKTEIVAAAEIL
jgi:hypothetical protein